LLALEAALTAWSAASSVLSSGPQKTALVVDSGAQINELLDGVFASESWSVEHVPDNCAALLTAAAKGRETNSQRTWKSFTRSEPFALMRPIILADQFTPGDVFDAMREGAFSYFSGPFEREALIEMVREAMKSPCWDDGIEVLSGIPTSRQQIAWSNSFVELEIPPFLKPIGKPSLLLSEKFF
jgi:hypothetical protein